MASLNFSLFFYAGIFNLLISYYHNEDIAAKTCYIYIVGAFIIITEYKSQYNDVQFVS